MRQHYRPSSSAFFSYLLILLLGTALLDIAYGQSSQIEKYFSINPIKKSPSERERINRTLDKSTYQDSLAFSITEFNKTVDSVMEDFFYNVLDQSYSANVSDEAELKSSYSREVISAGLGRYIVLDKFMIGPQFLKGIDPLEKFPIETSGSSSIFITNARPRLDAQRLAEGAELSVWDSLTKNWLGLLPILAWVLPPSFNTEELYDPINYLQTPFLFPTRLDEALALPLGTVRSYGATTSGRTSLTDLITSKKEGLKASTDLTLALPIGSFIDREHKISVFRHSSTELWVALTESKRFGVDLELSFGNTLRSLGNLVTWWQGVNIPIFPIKHLIERGTTFTTIELYSYDLSNPKAIRPFENALRGDFSYSRASSDLTNGVEFQFKKTTEKKAEGSRNENSFYLRQIASLDNKEQGEVQSIDHSGSRLILEAEQRFQKRDWNILVGAETIEYLNRVSIPVTKKLLGDTEGLYQFDNRHTAPPQRYITSSFKIIDNFVDNQEYGRYLKELRKFSGLALDAAPHIPEIPASLRKNHLKNYAFLNPSDRIQERGLGAPLLGKMEALAEIYFSWNVIDTLASKSESEIWRALAESFGFDVEKWTRSSLDRNSTYYLNLLGSYALYPLKSLNVIYPSFAKEGLRLNEAFSNIRNASTPEATLSNYIELFDSHHPAELIRCLARLANNLPLPTFVTFRTEPKIHSTEEPDIKKIQEDFKNLNDQVFQSGWPLPQPTTNESINDKIYQMETGLVRRENKDLSVSSIKLSLEQYPTEQTKTMRLALDFSTHSDKESYALPREVYIRLESYEPFNMGREVLAELVFKLEESTGLDLEGSNQIHRVNLSGLPAKSPLASMTRIEDGGYDLYLSLSNGDSLWGPETHVPFRIENGFLKD